MLINAKPEELVKYSKGPYNKDLFVETVKNNWELTDLQIRMTYLVSDLAIKAEGVFSIAYNTFVNMFEERFKIKISLSSVRRFFGLLSNINVLSVNAAKRKNNKQSANIYIVEPIQQKIIERNNEEVIEKDNEEVIKEIIEQPHEQPYEHLEEQPYELHNITINKTLNKTINKPLNNYNCNYKKHETIDNFRVLLTNTCNEFYTKFSVGRYSKKQWSILINKFVDDTIESGRYMNVPEHKIKGFVYKCLEKIADNSDYKRSDDFAEYKELMAQPISVQSRYIGSVPFYNWLEE